MAFLYNIGEQYPGYKGSTRLEIIRGKYTKLSREKRICKLCSSDEHIGDELDFLLSCPKHKSRWEEFLKR